MMLLHVPQAVFVTIILLLSTIGIITCEKNDDEENNTINNNVINGEEACENQGFNPAECSNVGCCEWDDGECWSAVGQNICNSNGNHVQAVETNQCFANNYELQNAVNEYVGDGRCDINAQQCVPDPLNCGCDNLNQRDYRGTLSTTISGKTCQAWDAQSPHEHTYLPADRRRLPDDGFEYEDDYFPADYQGLEGGHNYCRNPAYDRRHTWCFTTDPTDPDEEYEYCDVPSCGLVTVDGSQCDIGKQYGWPINTWCVSDITNMGRMFFGPSAFNQDLSSWDVSSVTDMNAMFNAASAFNQDLSSWDVSSVADMKWMFNVARAFNQDLSSWNVSSVTNMWSMFQGASIFNQDLSSWDVSSVTTMYYMFQDAAAFNQDLSSWNVSSVKSMTEMFLGASAFNGDLSSWNVSSVTGMEGMFYGASAFNQDLSSWNVSSVTSFYYMFYGASAFNQDLCGWADTFNYRTSGPIFADSGCFFPYDPERALEGPFCASTCTEGILKWKRGDDPLCPDTQN